MSSHAQRPPRSGFTTSSSRYEPIAELGRGRLADVVLARMRIGRDVSRLVILRRLWPELAAQPNLAAMFLRQARIGARLEHPNIPRTYEIVDDRERPLVALEYLDGQRLSSVMQRFTAGACPLPLNARLPIVLSVLEALKYAHGLTTKDGTPRGVLHRDVCPRNVVVTYDGRVKLIDFGLEQSRFAAYAPERRGAGMLHYLSPEGASGGVIDHRADLFGVGLLLWELSAGRRLWEGVSGDGILRHLADGIPLPALPPHPDIPSGLGAVCARALAIDPEDRFESAAEFAADLEQAIWRFDLAGAKVLGEAVSVAFARERAARRKLTERSGGRHHEGSGRAEAVWSADTEVRPFTQWETDHQASDEPPLPPRTRHHVPLRQRAPKAATAAPRSTELDLRRTTVYVPRTRSHQVRWMALGFASALAVMAGGLGLRALLAARTPPTAGPAIVARTPGASAPTVESGAPIAAAPAAPAAALPDSPPRRTQVLNILTDAKRVRDSRSSARRSQPSQGGPSTSQTTDDPAPSVPEAPAPIAASSGPPPPERTATTRPTTALRPLDKSDPFAP